MQFLLEEALALLLEGREAIAKLRAQRQRMLELAVAKAGADARAALGIG
jgi:hypothetical protein